MKVLTQLLHHFMISFIHSRINIRIIFYSTGMMPVRLLIMPQPGVMRFLEDLAPEHDLIQTQPLFMSTTSKPKRMVFIGAEWILNDPKLEIISSI